MQRIDIKGKRFGRLKVLALSHINKHLYWRCRCSCGAISVVKGTCLRSGETTSCGCFGREMSAKRLTTHGHSKGGASSPTYMVWQSMIARCYKVNHKAYRWYGALGITVCKRWRKFENFLSDMSERPPGMSIDRKKNHLGYTPSNCRWANVLQQGINKTSTRWITFLGKRKHLSGWARDLGVGKTTLHWRIKAWGVKRALSEPAP